MIETGDVKIHPSWKDALAGEFQKPYFLALRNFLRGEIASGKRVCPPGPMIFNAFNSTPLDIVKVVILGQDPYHGAGQAHGLAFSVENGTIPPPSLRNIFQELQTDVGANIPSIGDLSPWAVQGVFLLNTILTVEASLPASHGRKGWEQFTDSAIRAVSGKQSHVVFILWGKYAQTKAQLVDSHKHLVLASAHPSPLSAFGGFFGSRPFSKANDWLVSKGLSAIDWRLP